MRLREPIADGSVDLLFRRWRSTQAVAGRRYRTAAGMREAGVLVDERDLAQFQPQQQDPIAIAYRGFRVTQTPPNSTGFTMLQMLKIAERFDLAALDPVPAPRRGAARPPVVGCLCR